jgi:hypothetical protein
LRGRVEGMQLRWGAAPYADRRAFAVPNQRFEWDVTIDTRVVTRRSSAR